MKTSLTPEQSATLIAKGISANKASERTPDYKDINNTGKPLERRELLPIFTLADLLSLIPKVIENGLFNLELQADNNGWDVIYSSYHEGYDPQYIASDKELIDVLYSALLWCIGNRHIDLTK